MHSAAVRIGNCPAPLHLRKDPRERRLLGCSVGMPSTFRAADRRAVCFRA